MDGSRTVEERMEALEGVLPAGAPLEMVNLLKLMLQEGDMDLPEVSAALGHAVSGGKQPVRAGITSATGIVGCSQASPAASFDAAVWRGTRILLRRGRFLMGGLRVRVGDRLIDTSVATRLAALRESLASVVR